MLNYFDTMRIKIFHLLTAVTLILTTFFVTGSAFAMTSINQGRNQFYYLELSFSHDSSGINNRVPITSLSEIKHNIENAIAKRRTLLDQDLIAMQTVNVVSQTASINIISKITAAKDGLTSLQPEVALLTTIASGNQLMDKVHAYHVYTIIDRWVKLYMTLTHLRGKLNRLLYLKGVISTSISALAVSRANLSVIQSAYSQFITDTAITKNSIDSAIKTMSSMTSLQYKATTDMFSSILPSLAIAKDNLETSYKKLRYIFSALSTRSSRINMNNLSTRTDGMTLDKIGQWQIINGVKMFQ